MLSCSHKKLYQLLADGELESFKDGRSRKITVTSIKRRIASQVASARPTLKRPAWGTSNVRYSPEEQFGARSARMPTGDRAFGLPDSGEEKVFCRHLQNLTFAKRRRASMNLVITPEKRDPANPPRHYRFEARLEGNARVLCVSHQPFVDAARVLVDRGYDPTEILEMRHEGSETIALTEQLGVAAKLIVEESANGGPRFAQHVPWSSDPALKQAAARRTYGATRQKSGKFAHGMALRARRTAMPDSRAWVSDRID
jgi:hypothetical protein